LARESMISKERKLLVGSGELKGVSDILKFFLSRENGELEERCEGRRRRRPFTSMTIFLDRESCRQ